MARARTKNAIRLPTPLLPFSIHIPAYFLTDFFQNKKNKRGLLCFLLSSWRVGNLNLNPVVLCFGTTTIRGLEPNLKGIDLGSGVDAVLSL